MSGEQIMNDFWVRIAASIITATIIGVGVWMIRLDYQQAEKLHGLEALIMDQVRANETRITLIERTREIELLNPMREMAVRVKAIEETRYTAKDALVSITAINSMLGDMQKINESARESMRVWQQHQDARIAQMKEASK